MQRLALVALVFAAGAVAACSGDRAAVEQAPAAGAAAAAGTSSALAPMLPATNDVAGWTRAREPRAFTPDTLWEVINGAADGFVTYGVREMVTADYQQAGTGSEAVIEVYQMKDPLNAFGKYAEERNPDARFLQVGNEGHSGGTAVSFWGGSYYVKLTTFQQKEGLEEELVKLAQSVASKITEPGAEPVELSWFPKEHQLPHSTLYVPKDVLSQSYFTDGFEARYKAGEQEYKLVLIVSESPAAAGEALERYREAMAKGETPTTPIAAPGDGGFVGQDRYYGHVVAVRGGRRIVVALGVASGEDGRRLVGEVLRRAR